MFARFRRPPVPVSAVNLSQNQANAALTKALHNVANVKLRNALKAAKAAANATIAERNTKIKELEAAINAAKGPVTAATNVAPNKPVEPATATAEAEVVKNVTGLITRIEKGNLNNKLNTINSNKNYNINKKTNINTAIAARKQALAAQLTVVSG